jgi:hypothetical protein
MDISEKVLEHYGVKGQKWGVEAGKKMVKSYEKWDANEAVANRLTRGETATLGIITAGIGALTVSVLRY